MSPSGEHHDIVERAALKRPPDRFSPQKGLSVPAVCRRNGGHSREQPRCHGIHLIFAPQLVEKQHIGGQTPHRLRDSHGLRTIQQDVAAPQRGLSGRFRHAREFTALIDDRDTVPPPGKSQGKLPRQIPQQAAFPAGRLPAEERTMYLAPAVGQGLGQSGGTAGMGTSHSDAQGGDSPHRDDLSVFHHRAAGHTGAAAAPCTDIPLPQFLLMGMDRIFAKGLKGFLQLLSCTDTPILLRLRRHPSGRRYGPFPRRRGQEQRRVRPQADLLGFIPKGGGNPTEDVPQAGRQIAGRTFKAVHMPVLTSSNRYEGTCPGRTIFFAALRIDLPMVQ